MITTQLLDVISERITELNQQEAAFIEQGDITEATYCAVRKNELLRLKGELIKYL